ncbi:MAG: sulfate adenylyltransferase subunit CysD [Thermomonas sp.]|nr:sulfate adenylyltransferase subunit CysD [Thermomonas sp.]MDI1254106.1 sulfate adenylyltransferase subunit CysD [Thermomonas sp.]
MDATLSAHLAALENEAIFILREAVAEACKPVLLFSAGKDSTVLAHLAMRAFHPARPPMPLLHIDSTWEFASLLAFRDAFAARHGFELIVHANEEGRRKGLNPFDHGDRYTSAMRTQPLKQALADGGFDIIFGGARRDEEASRAKERIVSVRSAQHGWDPRQQRPELWNLYNLRLGRGASARVFPLSNWTELDVLLYVYVHRIELAPLYFATPRQVVQRDGGWIVIDDNRRMHWRPGDVPQTRSVRFRTLGCWPVTAAVESSACGLAEVILETLASGQSERSGRLGDNEDGGSLEQKKREGYF